MSLLPLRIERTLSWVNVQSFFFLLTFLGCHNATDILHFSFAVYWQFMHSRIMVFIIYMHILVFVDIKTIKLTEYDDGIGSLRMCDVCLILASFYS